MSGSGRSSEPALSVRLSLDALVILVPACLTALFRPPVDLGLDGAFYLHLAHHVARGHGLVTSVSLYHQALHPLPQPSTVYPVWPLLLGAASRLLGYERAGLLVPKALYVLDTWLALRVLLTAMRRAAASEPERALPTGAAHLCALVFALNPVLLWCTSLPYSEGLSLAWVLLALLAIDRAASSTDPTSALAYAALAGLLSALLYLTRFQAVLAPLAAALTLLLSAPGPAGLARGLSALGAAAAPIAFQAWALLRLPHATPSMLLDFASYRQLPELPPFQFIVQTSSVVGWISDRVGGLLVALDPFDENSYFSSFGMLAYAPLAAALVASRSPRASLARLDRALRRPELAIATGAAFFGMALLLPIHAAHEQGYRAWLFGFRHGLPFALIGLLGLVALLRSRRRLVRLSGALIGALAAMHGARGILAHIESHPSSPDGLLEGAAFLARHPGQSAIAIDPQSLAVHTDASLYWAACWTAPDVLPTLLRHIPVRYVLLRPHEVTCPAFGALWPRLALTESLATGRMLAYELRSAP